MQQFELDLAASADESSGFGRRSFQPPDCWWPGSWPFRTDAVRGQSVKAATSI